MLTRFGLALLWAAFLTVSLGFGQKAGPTKAHATRPNLRERAAKGDAEAQFNLAKMYETGRSGYKKDYAQAEHWYRLAANQGDIYAQASLAILYRFGKGVQQNYVEAYKWFYLATAHSRGPDQESIQELQNATAARMNPAQIAEARRLASEWRPKTTQ